MEKQIVLPLSGDEVREAVMYKVDESLSKTCHLNQSSAYTAFSAEIVIRLKLVDYDRQVSDNHNISATEDCRESEERLADPLDGRPVQEHAFTIDAAPPNGDPPNELRIATGQDVPVQTVIEGRPVIKRVKYQARKAK